MTTKEHPMPITTRDPHITERINADEDLAFAGVVRLGELLREQQVTPRELTEFYLARIERLNPTLHAFVSVRPDRALAEADEALRRLQAGDGGALLGIPVAVKDNLDLAGEVTTHGAVGPHTVASADSEVIRRLRNASAIILGKTALCELASWGHFTSSAAHGVTRNPWNPDRSPGGSSGGSAAAVAAGMAPVALGSDGGGSIRIPSAFCGLFGLKPQRGRIPLAPLRDHWYGCTVLGALGRTVLDVATVDDALSADPGVFPARRAVLAEAAHRDPGRLRIAVSVKPAIPGVKPSGESLATIEQMTEVLRSLGHEVTEHELAHPQLLTTFTPRWAAGIRDDALTHADRLEPRTRRRDAIGRRLGGRALKRSLEREAGVARRLNTVFERFDLVMTPVTAAPPPVAEISCDAGALRTFNQGSPYVCYTPTWNYVGQPAASIPAGFDADGLPRAVQLAGPANGDTTIVSLAAQMETVNQCHQRRPRGLTA
jgi:amidase